MFLDAHQNGHQISVPFPDQSRQIEDTVNSALTSEIALGYRGNVGQTKYERYKFSPEIISRIKELTKLDNWHGLLALLEDCLLIQASILITSHVTWFFYPIALLIIGSRQRALTTILHDSAHGVLVKNKSLNWVLGTFCSKHHSYLGNPEQDPDFKFYLEEGLYDAACPRDFLVKHIIKPLLLFKVPQYMFYLVKHRLFGSCCDLYETIIMLAYLFTIMGASVWFGFWDELILFWLVPYISVFEVLGYFIEVS